jgi:hypothetical protein
VVISGVTPWFAILIPFLLMLYVHCEQPRGSPARLPCALAGVGRNTRTDAPRLRCAQS